MKDISMKRRWWISKVLKASRFWPVCPICSKKVSLPTYGWEKEVVHLPEHVLECMGCGYYFKVETVIIDRIEIRYSTRLILIRND